MGGGLSPAAADPFDRLPGSDLQGRETAGWPLQPAPARPVPRADPRGADDAEALSDRAGRASQRSDSGVLGRGAAAQRETRKCCCGPLRGAWRGSCGRAYPATAGQRHEPGAALRHFRLRPAAGTRRKTSVARGIERRSSRPEAPGVLENQASRRDGVTATIPAKFQRELTAGAIVSVRWRWFDFLPGVSILTAVVKPPWTQP